MKPVKKTPPANSVEARQAARKRRRRRRRLLQMAITLSVLLVLALVITLVVLRSIGVAASKKGETTSFLAVKAIVVEGDSRYTDEEIIEKSGLYVGQSLLAINKVRAHDALLSAFPYLNRVEIGNSRFDTVRIAVEETTVLGAVETASGWMVVGTNNRALELLEEAALPEGILQIKGASLAGEEIGKSLLDERSLGVCTTLTKAAGAVGLTGLSGIDITEKTNIHVWWNGRLQVVLGNESNLTAQIEAFNGLLPTLIKNNGENVAGRMDMTSYADDDPGNDRGIYTSPDLLKPDPKDEEPTNGSGEGSAGDKNEGETASQAPENTQNGE